MKTLITNLVSRSLFLSLLFVPELALAKLVGKVHAISGDAFQIYDGKTQTLKKDMDIYDGAQLMVSDDARLTVGDFYDRRYHLKAGSHFSLADRAATLHKGGVWCQSRSSKSKITLMSANMLVHSQAGEHIMTYDTVSQMGQLTVIGGEVDLASPKEPAFRYAVAPGWFSLAQPEVEDGYPRAPTQLGYDSLMKTVAQFRGIQALDAGVARAQKEAPSYKGLAVAKPGQVIFIKSQEAQSRRSPASVGGDEAQSYYLKLSAQKSPVTPVRKVSLPRGELQESALVRVYGAGEARGAPVMRAPASVAPVDLQKPIEASNSSEFLKSYELHRAKQPRHSPEVQRLIDDLKSH